jgi:co-chaperonin GroES (HSP10)
MPDGKYAIEAMNGILVGRRPAAGEPGAGEFAAGVSRLPSGLHVARSEAVMRPTILTVVSVGGRRPDAKGAPGCELAVKAGESVFVPEYGTQIHESKDHGELRCYEFSQALAVLLPDDDGRTRRAYALNPPAAE